MVLSSPSVICMRCFVKSCERICSILLVFFGCVCLCFSVYEEEGPGVSVTVELHPSYKSKENDDGKITLGSLKLQPDVSWVTMDNKICEIFKVCGEGS